MTKDRISESNPKQKIILVAVVLVVALIIWQVMSLFSSPTPPPAPPVTKTMPANGSGGASNKTNGQMPTTAATTPPDQLKQGTLPVDPQFNKMQTTTEEKYVTKLNELEDLKIQRQIAETNQAISAAKLATVTAEKDISDLLTKPAPAVPLPGSAYANQLVSPTTGGGAAVMVPVPPKEVEATVEYSVISVTMQLNKWSAVLGYQNRLFNVTVGDVLPPDHSIVININKSGVTLKKDGETRKLSMISSI